MMNKELLPEWIARFTGTSSVIGSSLIIYMIFSDRKRKLVRPYHRIMLMMSVFDVLQSMALVFSEIALPHESGIYGAKGNARTCTAQGFFMVLGLAVPLYNSCLNIYYVLTIRYNVSSQQFAKFEPILHVISFLVPLSTAIILTANGNMVPRMTVCYPSGMLPLVIISVLVSFSILVCIISMICICWTVISQSATMKKYTNFERKGDSSARRSRIDYDKQKTINQAALYLLAFISTYAIPILNGIYSGGRAGVGTPYAMIILSSVFYPLQGVWNLLLYTRPGVQRTMKRNPNYSYLKAFRCIIFSHSSVDVSRRRSLDMRKSATYSLPPSRLNVVETIGASGTIIPLSDTDNPYSDEASITSEFSHTSKSDNESESQTLELSFTSIQEYYQQEVPHMISDNTFTDTSKEFQQQNISNMGVQHQDYEMTEDYTSSSSETTTSITNHEEQFVITTSMPLTNLHSSSDLFLGNLANPAPRGVEFSEVDTMKDDIESQLKVQSNQERKVRRASLVSIASILNGENSWEQC